MPVDNNNNQIFISREKSGFSDYLDFSSMRTNAINYLGPITSKYWTDYNVHDPGITILEVLIYALMDLGYRASFPVDDILARGPTDKTKDNNFYSPAQILGSGPLTIIDYRKKLMDLEEVRNAWLEIDQTNPATKQEIAIYINGLYQVYIELEKDIIDFKTQDEWGKYKDKVFKQVKNVLLEHRNLCEDFTQVHFLCKMPIGICVDIEINTGSDIGETYLAIVTALHNFFSPAPTYYTLGELVEKKIPLDTIFEGRPYNGLPSHGFLLDNELPERWANDAPIHISDVYQKVLQVTGVKAIRKLQLRNCDSKGPAQPEGTKDWEFFLPPQFLPEFSLDCSAFRFFQNGQLLPTNFSSYNTTLEMNFAHQGKVIYPVGAPSLDKAIPNGNVREGLGGYFSIQNDFPKVYGIGPGGLPVNVSTVRQSQALQLKAYLLFFDQLLADYLSQLSHIRDLFSLSSDKNNNHTYFPGDLSTVPDLDRLLRFPGNVDTAAGAILVFPINKKKWDTLAGQPKLSCANREKLQALVFSSADERNNAVQEWILSFTESLLSIGYMPIETRDPEKEKFIYYITSSQNNFVLVSKNSFDDIISAKSEVSTVQFIGATKESYSLISVSGNSSYTFNLVQTAASYFDYLKTILESKSQYTDRRTGFLNHLMSRFAESFTDYALLSTGFLTQGDINTTQLGLMEKFLANFPALSANRGKAVNYLNNSWDNKNASGFEKRYKAYCGIEGEQHHYLCNFEVHKYEEQYNIEMQLAGKTWLACLSPLQKKEILPAIRSLFHHLSDRKQYKQHYLEDKRVYVNEISFYEQYQAQSTATWPTEKEAGDAADMICNMYRLSPEDKDIWVSQYEHRLHLYDHKSRLLRTSVKGFAKETAALSNAKKLFSHINETEAWAITGLRKDIGKLYQNRDKNFSGQYIDTGAFKIYIQKDVIDKPDRCSFEVLDQFNKFHLYSKKDFDTEENAKAACYQLLFRLATGEEHTGIQNEFRKEPDTKTITEISNTIRQQLYSLQVAAEPIRWKFNFHLGLPGGKKFLFQSVQQYVNIPAALEAAASFHNAGPSWTIRKNKDELLLEKSDAQTEVPACRLSTPITLDKKSEEEVEIELKRLLQAKKEIYQLASGDEQAFRKHIQLDEPSKKGTYMYRIVDKDHPRALNAILSDKKEDADELREALIAKGRKGYSYLQICLGGDNIFFEPELGQYYFQIKCRNNYFSRRGVKENELVLFESVQGFATAELAQQAFQLVYLTIFEKAMEDSNYGDDKYISLQDRSAIPKDSENKPQNKIITVFVPAATRDAFAYASLNAVNELMHATVSYPIRYDQDSKQFQFVLINEETDKKDWQGAINFTSVTDTDEAFDFFLLLLNYPGNYYTELHEENCKYHVGLREVLAESVQTFKHPEEAWGKNGVERFICVAQSEGSFHMNMRKNCTYSYFLACPGQKAIHPCQYETAEKREEARLALYHAGMNFPLQDWLSGFSFTDISKEKIQEAEAAKKAGKKKNNKTILYGLDGKEFAEINIGQKGLTLEKALDTILDIGDALWEGNNFREDKYSVYLLIGKEGTEIRPIDLSLSFDKWKEGLLEFMAYFPITRKINEQGGIQASAYYMELKLPGFVDLPGNDVINKNCGCQPQEPATSSSCCYVAWKSKTPFKKADSAWAAYKDLLPHLAVSENYHPVLDCSCGTYGIELYENKSDIVARNPQYYFYPEMVCDAITRARTCINAEGLDIVEHILLRPRKENTTDEKYIPGCSTKNQCKSIWNDSLNIIPGSTPSPSFIAGEDHYSFIMTVALPSWPERFRKKENRVMLENILQREAPAHILLRILWLTPMDMCSFEGYYKSWLNWVSMKTPCGDFTSAEFIEFLFCTPFNCLDDCEVCIDTSMINTTVAMPCFKDSTQVNITQLNKDWLSQINLLYCWKDMACSDTADWGVKDKREKKLKGELSEERTEIFIEEVVIVNETVIELVEEPSLSEKQRNQRINTRLHHYHKKILEMLTVFKDEEQAGRTEKFLINHNPSADLFKKIMAELVNVLKKSKGERRKDINIIIENVIGYYLDRISFKQESKTSFTHIHKIMTDVEFSIVDPENFYRNWNPEEMSVLVPGLNLSEAESVIHGI